MNLRICSPQVGVDPDSNLGGAVYDYHLLRSIADAGAAVHVVLPDGERYPPHPRWTVSRTRRHRWSYYEYNAIYARELRRIWKHSRWDVLRVHTPYAVGIGALAASFRLGVPTVLHYHHLESRSGWKAIDRLTLFRYDHVITVSEATRSALLRNYALPADRVTVIYQGVDIACTPGPPDPSLRDRWGDQIVAVHIGSLIARKNLSATLRLLERLRAEHDIRLRLVLIGTGPLEAQLRADAAQRGLSDQVEFWGAAPNSAKIAALRSADMYLHLSSLEGFGVAAVEAMACGMTVVAFDRPPIREIVRPDMTAVIVSPDDERLLVEVVAELVAQPRRRRELGTAAAADVCVRFSWARCAAATLGLYQSIAGRQ